MWLVAAIMEKCGGDNQEHSESWKAGYHVGLLDGILDRKTGVRVSDDEQDAVARQAAAAIRFETEQQREDWIEGAEAGYRAGQNAK